MIKYNSVEERINSIANIMANEFYLYYSKFKPVNKKSFMLNGKYFKYFLEASEKFCLREEFEPVLFIKCQFEKNIKYFPTQIAHETAWKTFKEYKGLIIEQISEEKELAIEITNAFQMLNGKSVEKYFENKGNILSLIVGQMNSYIRYFAFSKKFDDIYEEYNDKLEKPLDLKIQRARVMPYPKLIKWLKEKLGSDFIFNKE